MTGASSALQPRILGVVLLCMVAVRVGLGVLPGYPPDLETFKRWSVWGALNGIHTYYDEGSGYDYPPLYGFMLAPVGLIEWELRPSEAQRLLQTRPRRVASLPYSSVFSLLVKIPPLLFDLALAGLVGLLVHRHGMWRGRPDWGGWLPAFMILLHPAVLYLSGYLGHADVVHTFFVLLALTLILLRRPELGWVAAALGCMTKPLAGPYLPLLALATLMRVGIRRSCTAALTSWATLAVVLAPFWLTGRGELAVSRLFSDLDLLSMTSVNGHNLWWLLGGWQPADQPWLGPLTPKMIGLTLFGASYLGILIWVGRAEFARRGREDRHPPEAVGQAGDLYVDRHWYLAMAMTAFSFFVFSTHMHENHLFLVVPLLVLFAGWARKWAWLCVIVGLSILTNMVTHDLIIGEHVLSKIGGYTDVISPPLEWYKADGGDITRAAYLSKLELGLSYANSVVTLVCGAALTWWTLRPTRPS